MKTDQLIAILTADVEALPSRTWLKNLSLAAGTGLLMATALMVIFLGVRPDWQQIAQHSWFWLRLGFPMVLSFAAFAGVLRLAQPGVALGLAPLGILLPIILVLGMGAAQLLGAAPDTRTTMIFGNTWTDCLLFVSLLSLPAFVALQAVLRDLAPTRPVLAGAMAGLLSGALAASAYAIHCPEMTVPFLVWYLLGMLVPAALGALLGRQLRW